MDSSTSKVGIAGTLLVALALISLLIWWWSRVATPAPRAGLQPKVGVVLAELFAPGRVDLCTFIEAQSFSFAWVW